MFDGKTTAQDWLPEEEEQKEEQDGGPNDTAMKAHLEMTKQPNLK